MKTEGVARSKGQDANNKNGKDLISPVIKINYSKVLTIEEKDLKWHGYERLPQLTTISNTSSSILISGRWSKRRPFISGGPLSGSYIFSQIHFHLPSEHEIDGERYPLEMHAVHYKSTYSTQDKAMLEKDGTVVIVYLFQLSENGSSFLPEIIRLIPQLRVVNARITVDPKPLETILIPFTSNYLLYWGPILSAHSSYMLQWIICLTLLPVSEQQLRDLQDVLYFEKSDWLVAKRFPPEDNKVFHIIPYERVQPHEEMIYHAGPVRRKSASNVALYGSKELGLNMRDLSLASSPGASHGEKTPEVSSSQVSEASHHVEKIPEVWNQASRASHHGEITPEVLPSQVSITEDSILGSSTVTHASISPSLIVNASFERKSDVSIHDTTVRIDNIEEHTTTIQDHTDLDKEYEIQLEDNTSDEVKHTSVYVVTTSNSENPMQRARTPDDRRPSMFGSSNQENFPSRRNSTQLETYPARRNSSQQDQPLSSTKKSNSLQESFPVKKPSLQQGMTSKSSQEKTPSPGKRSRDGSLPNVRRYSLQEPPTFSKKPSEQEAPVKKSSREGSLSAGKRTSLEDANRISKKISQEATPGKKSTGVEATSVIKKPSREEARSIKIDIKYTPQKTPPASKKPSREEARGTVGKSSPQGTPLASRKSSKEEARATVLRSSQQGSPLASRKSSKEEARVTVVKSSQQGSPLASRKSSKEEARAAVLRSSQQGSPLASRKSSKEEARAAVLRSSQQGSPLASRKSSKEEARPNGIKTSAPKTPLIAKQPSREGALPGVRRHSLQETPAASKKSSQEEAVLVENKSFLVDSRSFVKSTSHEEARPVGNKSFQGGTSIIIVKKSSKEEAQPDQSKSLLPRPVSAGKKSSSEDARLGDMKSLVPSTPPNGRRSSLEESAPAGKKSSSEEARLVGVKSLVPRTPPNGRRSSLEESAPAGKKSSSEEARLVGVKSSMPRTPPSGRRPSREEAAPAGKKPSREEALPAKKKSSYEEARLGGVKSSVPRTPPNGRRPSLEESAPAKKKSSSEEARLGGMKSLVPRTPPNGRRPSLEQPAPAGKKSSRDEARIVGIKSSVQRTPPNGKRPSREEVVVKSALPRTPPSGRRTSREEVGPAKKKPSSEEARLSGTALPRTPPMSKKSSREEAIPVGKKSQIPQVLPAGKRLSNEEARFSDNKSFQASKTISQEAAVPAKKKSLQQEAVPVKKKSPQPQELPGRKNSFQQRESLSPRKKSLEASPLPSKKSSYEEAPLAGYPKESGHYVSFSKQIYDRSDSENEASRNRASSGVRSIDEEMFIGPLRRRNTKMVSQATDHFQDINTIQAQQVFSPKVSVDNREHSEVQISTQDKNYKGEIDSRKKVENFSFELVDKSRISIKKSVEMPEKKDVWASILEKYAGKDLSLIENRIERLSVLEPEQHVQFWTMKIGYRRLIHLGEGIVTPKEVGATECHFLCDRIEKDIVTGRKILVGKFEEVEVAKSSKKDPSALLEIEASYVYVSPTKDYMCNVHGREDFSSGSDESFKLDEEMSIPTYREEFFISSISEFDETEDVPTVLDSFYRNSSEMLLSKKPARRVAKISIDFNINPERVENRCNDYYELPTAVRAFKARYIEIPEVNKTIKPTKNDISSFNKNEVRDSIVFSNISMESEFIKSEEYERKRSSSVGKNYKVMYIPCLDYFVPTKL